MSKRSRRTPAHTRKQVPSIPQPVAKTAALVDENGRVLAAMPLYEMVFADYFQSFMPNIQGAVGVITHKGSYVMDAQNLLARQALLMQQPWKWLYLLEQDMAPPPGIVALAREYPPGSIVGTIYYGRNPVDQRPVCGWFDADQHVLTRLDGRTHDEWVGIEGNQIVHPENQGLHEIDVVGTGCTFIHRDVLENWNPDHEAFKHERHTNFCNPRHFPWFQTPPGPDTFMVMSTDTFFCWHAREQGFKVYLDSRVVCGHMGVVQMNLGSHLGWRMQQPPDSTPPATTIVPGSDFTEEEEVEILSGKTTEAA